MTTDIKALIKRLHEKTWESDRGEDDDPHTAADALEAMAGKVERLKETITTAVQFNEGLAAERDRLKAALVEIKRLSRLEDSVRMSAINQLTDKALGGDAS